MTVCSSTDRLGQSPAAAPSFRTWATPQGLVWHDEPCSDIQLRIRCGGKREVKGASSAGGQAPGVAQAVAVLERRPWARCRVGAKAQPAHTAPRPDEPPSCEPLAPGLHTKRGTHCGQVWPPGELRCGAGARFGNTGKSKIWLSVIGVWGAANALRAFWRLASECRTKAGHEFPFQDPGSWRSRSRVMISHFAATALGVARFLITLYYTQGCTAIISDTRSGSS